MRTSANDVAGRHTQALEIATTLVEDIRRLTKGLPEEEDMVMVPMLRDAVMTLHKDIMMLARGDCDEEMFYRYTDEAFGKLAVMRVHLEMCLSLEYVDQEVWEYFEKQIGAIEAHIALPKKAKLEVVK